MGYRPTSLSFWGHCKSKIHMIYLTFWKSYLSLAYLKSAQKTYKNGDKPTFQQNNLTQSLSYDKVLNTSCNFIEYYAEIEKQNDHMDTQSISILSIKCISLLHHYIIMSKNVSWGLYIKKIHFLKWRIFFTYYYMNEPCEHYAKWNKSNSKIHIKYGSTLYDVSKSSLWRQKQNSGYWVWEEGEKESCCLMDLEF